MESGSGILRGVFAKGVNANSECRPGWGAAVRLILLIVLLLMLTPAWAQSTNININATVVPTRQPVAQGISALSATALHLRSAQFAIYRNRNQREHKKDEQAQSSGIGGTIAPLGALLPVLAATGELGADFAKLNTFGDVTYRFGEHERTPQTPAHEISTLSVFLGVDYRIRPDLVLGVAGAYLERDNVFANGGSLTLQSKSLTALVNWYVGQSWYIDGVARYADISYDIVRQNRSTGATIRADPNGDSIALSSGTGYDFNFGPFTLVPRARAIYKNVTIEGYTESGGVQYESQEIESFKTELGGMASYVVNTNFGVVLTQLDFEWVHEYNDDGRFISGAKGSGSSFAIPVEPLDENFFRIALVGTTILTHGRIFFLRYEVELERANTNWHTLVLGMRLAN